MHKKRIAITGGIGSGKSTVLSYLKEKGYAVFSCDEIYRKIVKDEEYIRLVQSVFPDVVYQGSIDKERLANVVFSQGTARERLNSIAHPWIMRTLFKEIGQSDARICFAEVPLLFENGFEKDFDKVLVVLREKEQRIQAVVARDGQSKVDVEKRLNAQFNYEDCKNQQFLQQEKFHILYNSQSIDVLYRQIDEFLSFV